MIEILCIVLVFLFVILLIPGRNKENIKANSMVGNFPPRVDCIDIPRTYGKSNYMCRGKGMLPNCYRIGKNPDFPDGFADYAGSNRDLLCNNSFSCSEVANQCGLSALANLQ